MPLPVDPTALVDAVRAELASVQDPEIRRPITELGMVRSVDVGPDGAGGTLATVGLDLTTPGCPLKETLTRDITAAGLRVPGITAVHVAMGVMSVEQRTELRSMLRGGSPEPVIPFAQPQQVQPQTLAPQVRVHLHTRPIIR